MSPAPAQQAAANAPVMRLALKDAVALALAPEGNARVRLAEELLSQARARSTESRAALLPNISASVGEQSVTRNLEAFGLHLDLPIPGFSFPVLVGPFNVFDARATASQTILNLSAVRRYQASRSGIRQAESEKESAGDEVRALVARAYIGAVRAQAIVEAAQADVALAEAVLKLANDQKGVGTGTGIEVTRAGVQLASQKQRLLVARNQLTAAHLRLLREMHLNLTARLELTDGLAFVPVQTLPVDQELRIALETRADWQAQQKKQETARLLQSASRMERLPSVNFFADYGSIGTGMDNAIPTRAYGFIVQVPVFDGGRVDARRVQSISQYRQEAIHSDELRAQIELEVRLALDTLQSAEEQVRTAEEGLVLAENEVAQAERRYRAGASPGLEVTDAQTRLERARENRISALFAHNLARIDLAAALGTIRQVIQ
jgi:outer membrane protein